MGPTGSCRTPWRPIRARTPCGAPCGAPWGAPRGLCGWTWIIGVMMGSVYSVYTPYSVFIANQDLFPTDPTDPTDPPKLKKTPAPLIFTLAFRPITHSQKPKNPKTQKTQKKHPPKTCLHPNAPKCVEIPWLSLMLNPRAPKVSKERLNKQTSPKRRQGKMNETD